MHTALVSMRLRRRGPSCCRIVEHGHLAFTRSQLPMRADVALRVMNHAGNDAFPRRDVSALRDRPWGQRTSNPQQKTKKKHRVRQRDRSVRAPPQHCNPSLSPEVCGSCWKRCSGTTLATCRCRERRSRWPRFWNPATRHNPQH